MTLGQAPYVFGFKLGMTVEQVTASFPGIKEDAKMRSILSRPADEFGQRSFTIRPEKYRSKQKFDGVSQIVFTFLDGRVSNLYVGYESPVWNHVDEFVAKFSEENGLPGAESWDAYVGMDTQLKTLKGRDFEVSLFTGGDNLSLNYVRMIDFIAQGKLEERVARASKLNGTNP
jgi:hypothetical protein